ncbi:MAG: DUF3037 domain-containing protein [Bacteroidetes bacterium]|nr:DUF3037 domain-containing protein [Bacteroidota bacterium]
MSKSVSYSILKYTHSKLLGEELNVGILFVFPESRKVAFVYPRSLIRIRRTYPSVSVDLLKSYLTAFRRKAETLGAHIDQYVFNYDELISEQFLVTDGSSLQFTPFNHALLIGDIENTTTHYYKLYLSNYDAPIALGIDLRKTDKSIVQDCKRIILNKRPEIEGHLYTDKFVLHHDKVVFRPDLRWQNGTLNLIKGVSFDFKDENDITDKALLIQNQLNYLESEVNELKARVDLIVSKPSDSRFLDAYSFAIDLLNESRSHKEIIEEKDLDAYTDSVVTEIEI